jgi:hypothetical protein
MQVNGGRTGRHYLGMGWMRKCDGGARNGVPRIVASWRACPICVMFPLRSHDQQELQIDIKLDKRTP